MRKPKSEAVEEAWGIWFSGMQSKNASSAKIFPERLHCEDFTTSSGWLCCFKARHGIFYKPLHGEGSSVDSSVVQNGRGDLQQVTSAYHPQYIYNMDETGLLYWSHPVSQLNDQ